MMIAFAYGLGAVLVLLMLLVGWAGWASREMLDIDDPEDD